MVVLFINRIPVSIQMLPDENQKLNLIKQIRKSTIHYFLTENGKNTLPKANDKL